MAVRSKRLWDPTAVPAAVTVLYTGPAGETTLLKTLTISNNAGVSQVVSVLLNATTNGGRIVAVDVAAGHTVVLDSLFIVLQPGDILRANCTLASCVVTGFGAQLEGVAD